jgi:hypothetical protein
MPRPPALQAGIERKRAAGGRVGGQAPYGWRWNGPALQPVWNEQAVRFLVLHMRDRLGYSLPRIADELERLELPMRSGLPWRRDALHRITRTQVADMEAAG